MNKPKYFLDQQVIVKLANVAKAGRVRTIESNGTGWTYGIETSDGPDRLTKAEEDNITHFLEDKVWKEVTDGSGNVRW